MLLASWHQVLCCNCSVLIMLACLGCNKENDYFSKIILNNQQQKALKSKTELMAYESRTNDIITTAPSIDSKDAHNAHFVQHCLATTNMTLLLSQYIEAECALCLGSIRFSLDIDQDPFYGQDTNSIIRGRLTRESSRVLVDFLTAYAIADVGEKSETVEVKLEHYLIDRLQFSRQRAVDAWSASRRRQQAPSYQYLISEILSREEKDLLDVMTSYFTSVLFQELSLKRIFLMQQSSTNSIPAIVQGILVNDSESSGHNGHLSAGVGLNPENNK